MTEENVVNFVLHIFQFLLFPASDQVPLFSCLREFYRTESSIVLEEMVSVSDRSVYLA